MIIKKLRSILGRDRSDKEILARLGERIARLEENNNKFSMEIEKARKGIADLEADIKREEALFKEIESRYQEQIPFIFGEA